MVEILEKAIPAFYGDAWRDRNDETGYIDHYQNVIRPADFALIDVYRGLHYACININIDRVACSEIQLYVKTGAGDRPTILNTSKLSSTREQKVRTQFKIRQDIQIEEVIEHPVLDKFNSPHSSKLLNKFSLFNLTQLYLEITGKAYWWVKTGPFGIPSFIWLLPSQHVIPELNEKEQRDISQPIKWYIYDDGLTRIKLSVDEIIPFYQPNPLNLYSNGFSPTEASYESGLLINKLQSMTTKMLDNEARPDTLITPDEPIGADEAKNWERRMNMRFRAGKGGGFLVLDEPAKINQLNYRPNDIARLDVQKNSSHVIANVHSIPVALLQSENINKMTLEAALTQHAMLSVLPRLKRNVGVLNTYLLPMYDNTGRLFLGFDDPVPENKEVKLEENVQLKMNGIKTANEAREAYNLPPHPKGDELLSISTAGSGEQQRQNARDSGEAEK